VDHPGAGLHWPEYLRNVGVVKNEVLSGSSAVATAATPGLLGSPRRPKDQAPEAGTGLLGPPRRPKDQAPEAGTDGRTRDRVARLLLERGAATAAELGAQLGLSPAAIRKHLDAMLADDLVEVREARTAGPRGRGRPAKAFVLTAAARESFPHFYDGIATAALRWIAEHGGEEAVSAFAAVQVSALEERCRAALREAGEDPIARAEALAEALTAEGYAANATAIASGGQLCQHHCPVAHVAAEFPQLCDAETAVISRLVGTHVQRLATIAHGDGVCTTHIPGPARVKVPTMVRTDR
jgi:predicted ArsR family transcriptional regulator